MFALISGTLGISKRHKRDKKRLKGRLYVFDPLSASSSSLSSLVNPKGPEMSANMHGGAHHHLPWVGKKENGVKFSNLYFMVTIVNTKPQL